MAPPNQGGYRCKLVLFSRPIEHTFNPQYIHTENHHNWKCLEIFALLSIHSHISLLHNLFCPLIAFCLKQKVTNPILKKSLLEICDILSSHWTDVTNLDKSKFKYKGSRRTKRQQLKLIGKGLLSRSNTEFSLVIYKVMCSS